MWQIQVEAMMEFLLGLLHTPSPIGYHKESNAYVKEAFGQFSDLQLTELPKGTLVYRWAGEQNTPARALSAHTDTLGFLVREIKDSGRLKLSPLGGINWSGAENENVTVRTQNDDRIRGTLILVNPSTHVNQDAKTAQRNEHTMEVRLDVPTTTAEETRELGIQVGDFVFIDPRVEQVATGYLRSRFLDDKACVAALFAAISALQRAGLKPARDTYLHISNYEEHGAHGGAAGIPAAVTEFLCLDMAAIGEGQASSEHQVSLCVKDASGPYHFDLNNKLRRIARENQITLINDIYSFYSSDGSAYWRAGGQGRVALIGPGVASSHGYERTHRDALLDTARLIAAYLLDPHDD
ncbi:MAG: M42 family metallopeptidase [Anaerolineaceae bacterium]|nr:M42 family metallopeptidase [Anaerolineaceae bacterium]